jgi:hypothetical protein
MKANIGNLDRFARIVVGIVVIGAGVIYQSWWGILGLLPLVTAFIRWCPAYTIFGINTCSLSGNSSGCDAKSTR